MNYWFSGDEHYGHENIIRYCNRPFDNVNQMNETLITYHNAVVKDNDIVIHAGDFCLLRKKDKAYGKYINRLRGNHVFLKGSHDYWIPWKHSQQVWERNIKGYYIVVCHYAMRVWATSHYNSFQLYGHSHGRLPPVGKQHDIGVDNNGFYPVSFDQIVEIMKKRDDNPNLIRR
jgi:calcineurin-like phosphoesterase family protein